MTITATVLLLCACDAGPPLDVLEGMRPADALLDFMKGPGGTSTFKLAQVFKHPNLRPRLFQRLCAAAAAASTPLDCSVDIPRLKAVNVSLNSECWLTRGSNLREGSLDRDLRQASSIQTDGASRFISF